MSRIPRMLIKGEPAVYHVMSRTALDGFPLTPADKDYFLKQIREKSRFFFSEILGFCIMDNHFHILLRMLPESMFTDEDIKHRYESYYGPDKDFSEVLIPDLREKLPSLSEFMKAVKLSFTRFFNKTHDRKGYFWGDRFKSVIVENGNALLNCLAYIDLNPIRAGIVKRPEDYKWSSIGYHDQNGNQDGFLSLDFGHEDLSGKDAETRFFFYRKFLYETGAIKTEKGPAIDPGLLEMERENNFDTNRSKRFLMRTRYFSDSGIIGSKEFVSKCYGIFREYFHSKKEKIPKPVDGLDGLYSLKRLNEKE